MLACATSSQRSSRSCRLPPQTCPVWIGYIIDDALEAPLFISIGCARTVRTGVRTKRLPASHFTREMLLSSSYSKYVRSSTAYQRILLWNVRKALNETRRTRSLCICITKQIICKAALVSKTICLMMRYSNSLVRDVHGMAASSIRSSKESATGASKSTKCPAGSLVHAARRSKCWKL